MTSTDAGTHQELFPSRTDWFIAATLGLIALGVYLRTLAPDVLYGDSAEFQALAYTLGITHSTGYPVYLLLARLVGFLPLASPAWRVNFFSALCGAWTVSGVYLLQRFLTPSRIGAVLGSLALTLTYTLWSQSVIAEVYTPATAFLATIMFLLAYWQQAPVSRRGALAWATGLACLGLGVHASAALIGPTALLFVLWVALSQLREHWWACLKPALLGFCAGITVYFLAFAALDLNNPPSSFTQVMLIPSRSIWGLQSTDVDSVFERWWLTVSGLQWRTVMFPDGSDAAESVSLYFTRVMGHEFSFWLLLLAMLGFSTLLQPAEKRRNASTELSTGFGFRLMMTATVRLGIFLLATFVVMLVFVLNYHPGDQYVFYLPTYLILAAAMGTGIGRILEEARSLSSRRRRSYRIFYPLALVVCTIIVITPHAGSRWQALKAGLATFAEDTYPYPRDNLQEPRQITTLRLYTLPEDAFVIMEWRALYTSYYLAHVEGLRPDIIIKEATPYGSNGQVADTLLEEMTAALDAGRPVYSDAIYQGLREHFRVMPAAGGKFYRLTPPRGQGNE